MRYSTMLALAASFVGMAAAATIEPVVIKNRHFVYQNSQKPFFVRSFLYLVSLYLF